MAQGLDAFRQANPQLELVAALRPGRHPHAAADYGAGPACASGHRVLADGPAANQHERSVDLKNLTAAEVAWHLSWLRSEKGHRTGNRIKRHLTSHASIQGLWDADKVAQQ